MNPLAPSSPPPATPAPNIVLATETPAASPPANPKKRFTFALNGMVKILMIVFGVFFLLVFGVSSVAAAIAYDKISINNPSIEKPIKAFVIGLPFTPKTPQYILEQAALAHNKVTKHSFDISLASKSDDYISSLGLNQIDVAAKGSVDYSDPKNLRITLNGSVTKDFNVDVRKNDATVYFKINTIPAFLLSMIGLTQEKVQPILENWVAIDTTPLDTEARKTLEERNTDKSLTQTYVVDTTEDLLDQKLLSNLTLTEEKLGNHNMFKIHLNATDKVVDELMYKFQNRVEGGANEYERRLTTYKPSDYIKDLVMDMWVSDSYLVHKIALSFNYNPNYQSPTTVAPTNVLGLETSISPFSAKKSSIALVLLFDNYQKEVQVKVPTKSIKIEELMQQIYATATASGSLGMSSDDLTKRGRDAARLSDLATLQNVINITLQEATPGSSLSTLLCNGGTTPCTGRSMETSQNVRAINGTGWVKANLNQQKYVPLAVLPVDPINNSLYHYRYCSDGNSWEINAVLESDQMKSKMKDDGGDSDNYYEVGSSLTLCH